MIMIIEMLGYVVHWGGKCFFLSMAVPDERIFSVRVALTYLGSDGEREFDFKRVDVYVLRKEEQQRYDNVGWLECAVACRHQNRYVQQ
jgi:hypothetical protein